MLTNIAPELRNRAARIKLAIFDVDGVLTDGKLWYNEAGRELKSFHAHDGLGLKRLLANHVEVAIITARLSHVVTERAAELGIAHVYQGQENKLQRYEQLLHALKLESAEVSYTGDDLPDFSVMQKVGLSIAVANAHPWIRQSAHWVTQLPGGVGAVREVCDLLLIAQDRIEPEFQRFV